jgi:hypothetical protein
VARARVRPDLKQTMSPVFLALCVAVTVAQMFLSLTDGPVSLPYTDLVSTNNVLASTFENCVIITLQDDGLPAGVAVPNMKILWNVVGSTYYDIRLEGPYNPNGWIAVRADFWPWIAPTRLAAVHARCANENNLWSWCLDWHVTSCQQSSDGRR